MSYELNERHNHGDCAVISNPSMTRFALMQTLNLLTEAHHVNSAEYDS